MISCSIRYQLRYSVLLLFVVWWNTCSPYMTNANAITKRIGLEPMNEPIDGFLESRNATNLSETVTSSRAHDQQNAQHGHTPKYLKLYRFKGYGISFIKPVTKLYSVGLGLKIPITANFPVSHYPIISYLPHLNRISLSLVGIR